MKNLDFFSWAWASAMSWNLLCKMVADWISFRLNKGLHQAEPIIEQITNLNVHSGSSLSQFLFCEFWKLIQSWNSSELCLMSGKGCYTVTNVILYGLNKNFLESSLQADIWGTYHIRQTDRQMDGQTNRWMTYECTSHHVLWAMLLKSSTKCV